MQFKINFEENQKKFRQKIEANAGDVAKHMKELTDQQAKDKDRIAQLSLQVQRLKKENLTYKNYVQT